MNERRATPRPTFDEPTLLPADDPVRHLWGDPGAGHVLDRVYVSSTSIHVLEFTLPAGGGFTHSPDNPTVFAADELLLVRDGTLLLTDPASGETQRMTAGDAVFFERDTWHHGRAAGSEPVRVLEFFSPTPATGASSTYAKQQPFLETPSTFDERLLARWPLDRDERLRRRRLVPVRGDDLAWALHGDLEVGLFAATEHLSVARCHLRAGASTPPTAHTGEAFVQLLTGHLVLHVPDAPGSNCLSLHPGDAAVLPPGTGHRGVSFGDENATFILGVAPGWRSLADMHIAGDH